jgi:hypothetical protein
MKKRNKKWTWWGRCAVHVYVNNIPVSRCVFGCLGGGSRCLQDTGRGREGGGRVCRAKDRVERATGGRAASTAHAHNACSSRKPWTATATKQKRFLPLQVSQLIYLTSHQVHSVLFSKKRHGRTNMNAEFKRIKEWLMLAIIKIINDQSIEDEMSQTCRTLWEDDKCVLSISRKT